MFLPQRPMAIVPVTGSISWLPTTVLRRSALLKDRLRRNSESLVLELAPRLPPVTADRGGLAQIQTNLASIFQQVHP